MSKISWKYGKYNKYGYIALSVALLYIVRRSLHKETKRNIIPEDFNHPNRVSLNSIAKTTTRSRFKTSEKIEPTQKLDIEYPIEPSLSSDILTLHERLNLTEPGWMGSAVNLPKILDKDIQEMVDAGYSKYKINEFVSRLIPLDRELPDVRYAKYCNYKLINILLKFINLYSKD